MQLWQSKGRGAGAFNGMTVPLAHALPFEAILEELRVLRPQKFVWAVLVGLLPEANWKQIDPNDPEKAAAIATEQLEAAFERQRTAYAALAVGKQDVDRGSPDAEQNADIGSLERACWEADQPLKRVLYTLRGNAVAFSGGGIRSASFCLGVLQGLARFSTRPGGEEKPLGLLHDTQYLSTVSGGGYVGSWLSAWIARRARARALEKGVDPEQECAAAYREVVLELAGAAEDTSGDPAPEPVRHLRQFTSFLAPRLGFSLDVWTLAAIVMRNLAVNWLMILPLLTLILLVPLFASYLLQALARAGCRLDAAVFYPVLACLLVVIGLRGGLSLPSYSARSDGASLKPRPMGIRRVIFYFLLPSLLAAALLMLRFYPRYAGGFSRGRAIALCACAAVGYGVIALLRWSTFLAWKERQPPHFMAGTIPQTAAAALLLVVTVAASLVTGVTVELAGGVLLRRLPALQPDPGGPPIAFPWYTILALPIFLAVIMIGSSMFSAFTDRLESEEDREWWARAGGLLMMVGFLWTAGTALALLTSPGRLHPALHWILPTAGAGLGGLTSWLAKSTKTTGGTRPEKNATQSSLTQFLEAHNLIMPLMSFLALALIAVGLVDLAECLRRLLLEGERPALACGVLILLLAAFTLLVNYLVNINIFSLHGMYRMRLARALLGASNEHRRPDPFTHFDKHDSPHMMDLARTGGAPLHILSTTLNLVGTKRAEWRQRKAESFTFSAVSAGSWRLNYVNADDYGGGRGVTLATAMAISGAAANPNMGYHSSPLVTLLMALFNVRLGWWLPNPTIPLKRHYGAGTLRYLRRSGPTLGVWPLIEELFGLTDDDGKWIELTDGGHFENLGLYEMVMRRCPQILVVDAGADPAFHFEDLGNAVRKIEIDLGIPIRFTELPRMDKGVLDKNRYCAVAEIQYDCVDSGCFRDAAFTKSVGAKQMNGKLVYMKACLAGSMPMDVREYAFSHDSFPHEPTSNQFFNEAQFESYRHLGSSVVDTIAKNSKGNSWESWIGAAEAHAAS